MSPNALRSFLLLLPAMAALAVDVDPPEVPNPYNTSEARAIRDVMAETYHQKLSDKVPVEELRTLYRKAWNNDQQRRLDEGKDPDPKWLAAHQQEEAQEAIAVRRKELARLGGTATATMDADALDKAITERRAAIAAEQKAKAAADLAAQREAAAKQIEEEQRRQEAKERASAASTKKTTSITLDITPKEAPSAQEVINRLIENKRSPGNTQHDLAKIQKEAEEAVAVRTKFQKSGYTLSFISPIGIEIWTKVVPTEDPERMEVDVRTMNYSEASHTLNTITIGFTGSKRNDPNYEVDTHLHIWTITPFRSTLLGPYYVDPGQTLHMIGADITADER